MTTDPHDRASTGRRFTQEDVFRARHVVDAAMTAACDLIVYQLIETVPAAADAPERQRLTLWKLDPATGLDSELTGWAYDARMPVLAPDGASLFFLAAPSKDCPPQLYRQPLGGGHAVALTDFTHGVAIFALSPDGSRIALAARDADAVSPDPSEHIRISRLMYRFDGVPGYLQDCGQALYLMPASGGAVAALSKHDGLITALAFDPAGERIAFMVAGGADSRRFGFFGDLHVADLAGNITTLLRNEAASALFWSDDRIGYATFPDGNFSRQPQLHLVAANGDAAESRTSALDLAVNPLMVCNNPSFPYAGRQIVCGDQSAIVTVQRGGEVGIYRVALSGPEIVEPLVTGPRICRPLCLQGDLLVFAAQGINDAAELWSRNLTSGEERRLTALNADWQDDIAWPELERVTVESAPGSTIEGWLLTPPGRPQPHPTILYIHGGPHAGFGYGYCEDFHELVGAGYAVLFANPRGSTGYGDAFSTAIVGRWGEPEFEDFTALLDLLVDRGLIDPERLGVTGVSGGGHLSAWLITHSDRFRAAVPEEGVYNLVSFYGTSDAGIALASLEMDGHPHECPERYWNLSPIAHAHGCRTPTLLIQGEADMRCPMEQAEQLYTVLKYNGCVVELLRLTVGAHGAAVFGPPALRRARMDAIKEWFGRFIAPALHGDDQARP